MKPRGQSIDVEWDNHRKADIVSFSKIERVKCMTLIVDVSSREEFVKSHIKGSLNIPVFDLKYYINFLKGQEVRFYCNSERRSKITVDYLDKKGIKASFIPTNELDKFEKEGHSIVCAVNYLTVKPGIEKEFEEKTRELCQITYAMKGFLGSKIFRVASISYGGSMLQGSYKDIDVKPTKYVMLTYWKSREAHEEFHKESVMIDGFKSLMPYLARMPYEEICEITR